MTTVANTTTASSADKRLTESDLAPDQREAYDAIRDWIASSDDANGATILTFAGLAGTGKTSVIGVLARELHARRLQVAYIAYTGRAASILKRKLAASGAAVTDKIHSNNERVLEGRFGHLFQSDLDRPGAPAFVGTIHKLLYRPIINDRTQDLLGWKRRDELDRHYDLIVADEASMIPADMLADIRNHNVPLLAVGDHGQLPPVMGSGDLMKHPDLCLERIHRQAEGNPIIRLAHEVRETGRLVPHDLREGAGGAVEFVPKSDLRHVLQRAYGFAASPLDVAILCWTNRNRIRLNSDARRARGISGPPRAGDLMLCLKNYPPVFNGCRGVVTSDAVEGAEPWILDVEMGFPEDDVPARPYEICVAQINRERPFASLEELTKLGIEVESVGEAGGLYDFGYAMTVHKMQGSGVPHVILYLDRPQDGSEDSRKFFYTAVTRASERLTVLV